jgi:hypothetical protein
MDRSFSMIAGTFATLAAVVGQLALPGCGTKLVGWVQSTDVKPWYLVGCTHPTTTFHNWLRQ